MPRCHTRPHASKPEQNRLTHLQYFYLLNLGGEQGGEARH